MKIKNLLGVLILASTGLLHAKEDKPDVTKIFAYPTATIKMAGEGWSGKGVVSENFTHAPQNNTGSWVFCNGLGKSTEERDFGSIFYKFIAKCEYGDLYVAEFTFSGGKKETVPFLYDGKTSISIERKGLSLMIYEDPK